MLTVHLIGHTAAYPRDMISSSKKGVPVMKYAMIVTTNHARRVTIL